jgi:HAD superfamily hydrolase (TIGR01490 family)
MRLTLFDLDHTLLSGDSDVLWCEFLMAQGLLDRAEFEPRNREMARRYGEGSVGAQEFCDFYVATLAGRSLAEWQPWCERFVAEVVVARIPAAAQALVEAHRACGDWLVLTTATNRLLTEPTARHLRIDDLLATEVALDGVGEAARCCGRTLGVPNMREGKLTRMRAWLHAQGLPLTALDRAVFYSDSVNDLPLLERATDPVATNPTPALRRIAEERGWRILNLFD